MSSLLSDFVKDLGFALRQLRRSPGFVAVAVLILSLGIAASVIVFGVLRTMVLDPLDVPRADRVVTFAPHASGYPIFSFPEVRDVRDQSTVFSSVGAVAMDVFGLTIDGDTEPVWGCLVSGEYFEAVGVKPFLGRLLQRSDDDHPGASEAAVLSYPAWKSRFNSDPKIVGKTVNIDKQKYTIVGVTEEGFYGTEKFLQPDLFVPMANQATFDGVKWLDDRSNKIVFPIARLKDGVTLAEAQSELDTLAARIARSDPKQEDGLQFKIAPPGLIGDFVRGPARRFLAGVMVLAGIVLLAACANLGSLFAARTADRTREIAIRLAVGSSRWRVLQQVLIEALVVSALGGVGACVLSWLALRGLAAWVPPSDYPIHFNVNPQPSLLLMAFAVSVVAGVLFGLMPLKQIFDTDPNEAIRSGSAGGPATSGGGGGMRRWPLRDLLLAAQIALCCVTVTAAFVSLRGLTRSLTMDLGIDPRNTTLTKFDLTQAASSGEAAERMQRLLQQQVAALPGVEAVGYGSSTPLADTVTTRVYTEQTVDLKPSNQAFETFYFDISPGYFKAAGTALFAGRDVQWTDTAKTPAVAVVNRRFAQSMFHTDNAVGRRFKDQHGVTVEVVGMVPDGKYFLTSEDPQEAVFFPILQHPDAGISLLVRMRPGAGGAGGGDMVATLRRMIHQLDPAIPIRSSGTWRSQLAFSFFPAQVATVALGLFGAFGLLLSIAGTFGLASYTVTKRMRELSLRVALGARSGHVLQAALGRMMMLIATGSLVGIGLGLATSQVLSHIVYQASAADPVVLVAVALTIVGAGSLAVAGPVRRALHADPATLLREQ